jgi:2-keto-3-deoxy-L-fuconate dehydrogenase
MRDDSHHRVESIVSYARAMTGRLADKTAFITAAAQGIGRATAIAMAREGAHVVATDVNAAALEALAGEPDVETRVLDVLDDAALAQALQTLPRLSILFNCAGYVHQGSILDCTPDDWRRSFDLNVRAMYVAIRAALPNMLRAFETNGRTASIVNMASIAGSIKGLPNRFAYGASKAAVIGLTKSVAADFIRQGVRCNAINPGTIQSPSLDGRIATQAKAQNKTLDEIRQAFIDRQPMARLGTPEEIASMAVYLASDEASYCTGQAFSVDGGFSL